MSEARRKVIVIEDEMALAKIMKLRLESKGYVVEVAGDAYQGTQRIFNNDYDLIILDLMMPAGGGFSLLDRVRRIPSKAAIPVIVITGKHLDADDRDEASRLDVSEIFPKPYDTEQFVSTVHRLAPV